MTHFHDGDAGFGLATGNGPLYWRHAAITFRDSGGAVTGRPFRFTGFRLLTSGLQFPPL